MPRYRLILEYDGGGFVGWQRQINGFSVQQALEEAAAAFSNETPAVFGAGRTDSGVHALGQVAHLDFARDYAPDKVRNALNFYLRPAPVAVLKVERVDPDFHARFSAKARAYVYRIVNRRPPPILERGRVWWVGPALDAARMHEAAQILVGTHDFTSFRATMCQAASPVKTLSFLAVERAGEEIRIDVRAPSFLHHQVRNIAGTLKMVGEGKWSAADVQAALLARDRAKGGPTAPPEGLYLAQVSY